MEITAFYAASHPHPAQASAPPPAQRELFTTNDSMIVVEGLDEVKRSVDELANQVSIAFHYLNQKRADINKIAETHNALAKSLDVAVESASEAWKNPPKVCPASDLDIAAALIDKLYYKTLYDILVVDAKKLAFELRDNEKQYELKRLKEVVAACDAMTKDTTASLTAVTDEEREFIDITSCTLKKQEQLKDPAPMSSLDDVDIPKEYNFRTGDQWMQTAWVVGYSHITGTINYLTSVAHRLHKLSRDLREDMKIASCGTLRANEELLVKCDELEGILTSYVAVLKTKPHSKQNHAGWYYLRGLLAQLRATKAAAVAFDKMKNEAFGTRAKITGKLVLCVKQEASLYHLYEAAEIASVHAKEMPDFKELIGIIGQKRLALSDHEKKLPVQAFASLAVSQDELSSYLMKGFIRAIYFSETCDPEFKLVVAKCSTTPQFEACINRSNELSRLYEHFKRIYGESEHKELLHILGLLYTPRPLATAPELLKLDRFMRFYQASRELEECRIIQKKPNPRIEYAQAVLTHMKVEWVDALVCKRTPTELYEILYTRFFDPNEEKRSAADEMISRAILGKIQATHVVLALLYRWVLEQHVQSVKEPVNAVVGFLQSLTITEAEVKQIGRRDSLFQQLAREYEQDAIWKAFFNLQYGEEYMKKAFTQPK